MRIAVLSNTRRPTRPVGPHGLGRTNHAIAAGLAAAGHDVTLFAGMGSEFEAGSLVIDQDEGTRTIEGAFDVVLDASHAHAYGLSAGELPVVNRMGDRETRATVPCAVVESAYMQRHYEGARLIRKGVAIDAIPLAMEATDKLRYVGTLIEHKGYKRALDVARLAGAEIEFAGTNQTGAVNLPFAHVGVLDGDALWTFIGQARAIVQATTIDAAPRLPLEAAACGAPVVCLAGDGSEEHVAHCVSGYVCESVEDMAAAVDDVLFINGRKAREWVADTHPMDKMISGYEAALMAAASGEVW